MSQKSLKVLISLLGLNLPGMRRAAKLYQNDSMQMYRLGAGRQATELYNLDLRWPIEQQTAQCQQVATGSRQQEYTE